MNPITLVLDAAWWLLDKAITACLDHQAVPEVCH